MADQEENVEQQEETAEETVDAPAEEASEAAAESAEPEAVAEEAAEEAPAETKPEAEAAEEAPAEAEPEAAPQEAAEQPAEASEPEVAAEAPESEASDAEPEVDREGLTFEVLHKMTVSDLRDVAQGIEHDALAGYSTMHKEQLVPALCEALDIEAHVHHEVVGINKDRVKSKIRDLKVVRAQAIEAGDHAQLKQVRSRIKSLKRKIRRATV